MPTRPPYPREAYIVTIEKGTPGQTVTWYHYGLTIRNLIRSSASIRPQKKRWMRKNVTKIRINHRRMNHSEGIPGTPKLYLHHILETFILATKTVN